MYKDFVKRGGGIRKSGIGRQKLAKPAQLFFYSLTSKTYDSAQRREDAKREKFPGVFAPRRALFRQTLI